MRKPLGESRVLAKELKPSTLMSISERFEEAPAKQARQHTHGQEEARPTGDPAFAIG